MNDVRQTPVLRNQRVIAQTHQPLEVIVVGVDAGEACDNGPHAASGQLVIYSIGPLPAFFFFIDRLGFCAI